MSNAKQYRKKPVVIEAMELNQHNPPPIVAAWCGGRVAIPTGKRYTGGPLVIEIDTLEGVMTARQGDFIIKGINGEFYPCKPDIFAKTYEPT